MAKIEVNFVFETIQEAIQMLNGLDPSTPPSLLDETPVPDQDGPDLDQPINLVPTMKAMGIPSGQEVEDILDGTSPQPTSTAPTADDIMGMVNGQPPVQTGHQATTDHDQDDQKVSGVQLKNTLREFKKSHGLEKYKSILSHFGVNAVRDIPKSDYGNVMDMVAQLNQDLPGGGHGTPEATVLGGLDQSPAPADVTAEQLKMALSDHKSRNGMEATFRVLKKNGYDSPMDIPVDQYGTIFQALQNDSGQEEQTTPAGVDLSMF